MPNHYQGEPEYVVEGLSMSEIHSSSQQLTPSNLTVLFDMGSMENPKVNTSPVQQL